jgi:AraC-like DNA-binding protein
MKIGQTLKSRAAVRPRIVGRIRVSSLLAISETEFARLIEEMEKDPLFTVLSEARSGGSRLLAYSSAPRTTLSPRFYEETHEETWASGESFDVEGFLRQRASVLDLVRRIGRGRFEEHFLYARSGKTLAEAALVCGLSPEEAENISRFLLEFSSRAEFFNPSGLNSSAPKRTTLVGEILKEKEFSVAFFSPHLVRGRYQVNEAGLREWRKDQPPEKLRKSHLQKLLEKIRLVNIRHSAFFRILSRAVDLQKDYLDSQDESRLAPASAEGLARELGLSPSTVSRSLAGKSVLLPWGAEVLISSLLPGHHKALMYALKKVLGQAGHPLTDAQLVDAVYRDFHLKASRRSINACRHELQESKS